VTKKDYIKGTTAIFCGWMGVGGKVKGTPKFLGLACAENGV